MALSDSLPVETWGRELMTPVTGQSEEAPERLDKWQSEKEAAREQWRGGGGPGGG